jgi:hypothetical protein
VGSIDIYEKLFSAGYGRLSYHRLKRTRCQKLQIFIALKPHILFFILASSHWIVRTLPPFLFYLPEKAFEIKQLKAFALKVLTISLSSTAHMAPAVVVNFLVNFHEMRVH